MASGVRPDSGTGILLSMGRIGRCWVGFEEGEGSLAEEKRQGGQTNGDGGMDPPITRDAGPGTTGGPQGTQEVETEMMTLDVTALEGGGTLSDTMEQQHGSPPLPSGRRAGLCQKLWGSSMVGRRPLTKSRPPPRGEGWTTVLLLHGV